MEHDVYDRGAKWLIGHQAGAMLTIGGARGFTSWRAIQAEVIAPKKLPDGLLEVFYPGQGEPELYLVEISTYPERRAEEQALADAMLVYLDRGRLPEVLTLAEPGSILFYDGSHRSFPGSDVTLFFIDLLPALPPEPAAQARRS